MTVAKDFIGGLLEFAYADLEDEARRGWLVNLCGGLGIAAPEYHPIDRAFSRKKQASFDWKKLKTLQEETMAGLAWIVDSLEDGLMLEFDLKYDFAWHKTFAFGPSTGYANKLQVSVYCFVGKKGYKQTEVDFPVFFRELFKALDGYSVSALRRCSRCRKIFFNPSKRAKEYCSQRCQHAAAAQRSRDQKKEED